MTGMCACSASSSTTLVAEGPGHDPLNHALEIPGHVRHGFPLAETDFRGRQIDGESAQLVNADVEGDSRAQRRLFENHRERLALERLRVLCRVRLDVDGVLDQFSDFRRA